MSDIAPEREQDMPEDKKDPLGEMHVESEKNSRAPPRKLDRSVQTAIGARLRAYYDGVAREAIPDRFVELLKELEKKELGGGKAK
jgi:hypothetical protein